MNKKFLYTVLYEIILKDWASWLGQIFTAISLVPCEPISTQDQQKCEPFDNLELLNRDFQLAQSNTRLLFTKTFTVTGFSIPNINHCFTQYKIFCRLYMIRETVLTFWAKQCQGFKTKIYLTVTRDIQT